MTNNLKLKDICLTNADELDDQLMNVKQPVCLDDFVRFTHNAREIEIENLQNKLIEKNIMCEISAKSFTEIYYLRTLHFIKELEEHGLINIPELGDITCIFIDSYEMCADIFKWYYYSGWSYAYELDTITEHFVNNEPLYELKWFCDNITPDYSSIDSIYDILEWNDLKSIKYRLDLLIGNGFSHKIKFFKHLPMCLQRDDMDIRVAKVNILLNFCQDTAASYKVSDIATNFIFPMKKLYKLNSRLYHTIFDLFITHNPDSKNFHSIYYGYINDDRFDNLPEDLNTYIESTLINFPIYLNEVLDSVPNSYRAPILSKINSNRDSRINRLIQSGLLII